MLCGDLEVQMNMLILFYLFAGLFYTLGSMTEWLHTRYRTVSFWRDVVVFILTWPYQAWKGLT